MKEKAKLIFEFEFDGSDPVGEIDLDFGLRNQIEELISMAMSAAFLSKIEVKIKPYFEGYSSYDEQETLSPSYAERIFQ